MNSHSTTALGMVYNTFCVLSWCICFLSTISCGKSPLQKVLLNAKRACILKPIFSAPISHFHRFPFPVSLFPCLHSSFLVFPVPSFTPCLSHPGSQNLCTPWNAPCIPVSESQWHPSMSDSPNHWCLGMSDSLEFLSVWYSFRQVCRFSRKSCIIDSAAAWFYFITSLHTIGIKF